MRFRTHVYWTFFLVLVCTTTSQNIRHLFLTPCIATLEASGRLLLLGFTTLFSIEPLDRPFQSGAIAVGAIQSYFQLLQGREGKPVCIANNNPEDSQTFNIKAELYYKKELQIL